MIDRYIKCTQYINIKLENIKRKIDFECGEAELYIKDVFFLISYKVDYEDKSLPIYDEEIIDIKYNIDLKIIKLDKSKICKDSEEDLGKFAKYVNEDNEIFCNLIEELLYDEKLETITEEELISKFVESIKDNLDYFCYQEIA